MSDDLFDEFVPKKLKKCIVAKSIDLLGDDDRAKILAAIARPDIPTSAILDWYRARGAGIFGRDSLRTHRIGECSCGR